MAKDVRFRITALDNTQRAVRSVQHNLRTIDRSVGMVTRSFAGLATLGGVGFAVKGIADATIEMQRLERGLRVASGSTEGAAESMAFLRQEASRLGLDLRTSAGAFVSLAAAARGTVLQGEATREIFTAVAESSRVLGLSVYQTEGALTAIEQMISKGKVSAEELRGQLGERLPGAFQIAARSIGKTTSELDDMLRGGELLAEDLLPAMAAELRRTFGPEVESAANDAAAAFARFETSVFELKSAIGESGLVDLLADVADSMRQIIAPTDQERLAEIRRQIEFFQSTPGFEFNETAQLQVRKLREQLLGLVRTMSEAKEKSDEARFIAGLFVNVDTAVAGATKRLQNFNAETDRVRAAVDKFHTEREIKQRLDSAVALIEASSDDLDDYFDKQSKRIASSGEQAFDELSVYADQAARNMQDAFADFLFDPFEEGLDGMLRGFLDIIRRMLAEQAAAQLFGFLGNAFGGTSDKIAGQAVKGFATGGQFKVGGSGGTDSQLVAFRATPDETVTVTRPGQGMGGVNVVNNYTINGADPERSAEILAPLFAQNRLDTINEIVKLQRDRRVLA